MAGGNGEGRSGEDDRGSGVGEREWLDGEAAARVDQALEALRGQLSGGISPVALSLAWLDWAGHLATMPARQAQLATRAWRSMLGLGGSALGGGEIDGGRELREVDPRFAGAGWRRWPFNVVSQTFLLVEAWWQEATTGVSGVSPHHEQMVSFWARQLLDMASPSNFPLAKPEVMKETLEKRGGNLVGGAQLFAEDWATAVSGAPPVGTEAFVPGETVAVTAGKVIYRNRLIELIQYQPVTEKVHPEAVLVIPAWIMKYYILDLSPDNSLVKYLVDNGHTVFMISWLNPTGEDRDLGMEDYRELGVMAALEAVEAIVGNSRVHAVGYCLGGTMLSIAAAAMARDGDDRLQSVTLLATETDFTEPGEIGLFIDESQVTQLESMMSKEGYLESSQMGGAFQMLRPYELIYSRIVSEYLLGERQLPNDLMAWNADRYTAAVPDALRIPARNVSRQRPVRGALPRRRAAGEPGRHPGAIFLVGTIRDHVVPWRSVYKLNLVAEAELTFVLTSGGHNAGIVSEPGHRHRRFQHAIRPAGAPYVDPDVWAEQTPTQEGSWWSVWAGWLTERSSERVKPPPLGAPTRGYPQLADAPGSYVKQR